MHPDGVQHAIDPSSEATHIRVDLYSYALGGVGLAPYSTRVEHVHGNRYRDTQLMTLNLTSHT